MNGPDYEKCGEHCLECRCMGSREIPIDWETVDELFACGSPGTEVAATIGIHADTLYRRIEKEFGTDYAAYVAKKRASGEGLIRLAQYKKALGLSKKGDNTLLIWLGKQRLNQKETISENDASQETTKHYLQVIQQLASLQSACKIDDKSNNSEQKSA